MDRAKYKPIKKIGKVRGRINKIVGKTLNFIFIRDKKKRNIANAVEDIMEGFQSEKEYTEWDEIMDDISKIFRN